MTITDSQSLVSVTNSYGRLINIYDDGYGPLWVYRTAGGIDGVVRAMTWNDAYECVLDEILKPISAEDYDNYHADGDLYDGNGELQEGPGSTDNH